LILIEPERDEQHARIRALHLAAFPTAAEADLVDRLRRDGDTAVSLVAVEGEVVLGNVVLSAMTAPMAARGLGPVAVAAARRNEGIGARLIRAAIDHARQEGVDAIFVLGDPAYYRRFGFDAEAAQGFESPYAGPYFLALALGSAGLSARSGRVDYAPAFRDLE
jgi:putative acetyltransferase